MHLQQKAHLENIVVFEYTQSFESLIMSKSALDIWETEKRFCRNRQRIVYWQLNKNFNQKDVLNSFLMTQFSIVEDKSCVFNGTISSDEYIFADNTVWKISFLLCLIF